MKKAIQIFVQLSGPLFSTGIQGIRKRSLSILFLSLFFLGTGLRAYATTYTVDSWRGAVTINNLAPKKGTTLTNANVVKFKKSSDYVIVKTPNGQVWSILPSGFVLDSTKGKTCPSGACKPSLKMGPPGSLYSTEVVSTRGQVLVNGTEARLSQKFAVGDVVSFKSSSDFLITKAEDGTVMLIRPAQFTADDKPGRPCQGSACRVVREPASKVARTRPAFYKKYLKPVVKP